MPGPRISLGGGRCELAAGQIPELSDVRTPLAGANREGRNGRVAAPCALGNSGDKCANLDRGGRTVGQALEPLDFTLLVIGSIIGADI